MQMKRKAEPLPLQPMPVFSAEAKQSKKREVAKAIDGLNARIIQLSPSKDFSDIYLKLITNAEAASNLNNWSEAHRLLREATLLVNRAIESKNNRTLAVKLAFTPLVSFILLSLITFLPLVKSLGFLQQIVGQTYVPYLWTGALGGTTIVFWGIVKHTILLDFDDQFTLWYWFKPLLGAIFGLLAVIMVKAGLLSLQIGSQSPAEAVNTLPLHVIAFLAGFSERFFIRLIDRVMTALFGGEGDSQQTVIADTGFQQTRSQLQPGSPELTVTDVVPKSEMAGETVQITNLKGKGFQKGAMVELAHGDERFPAENVNVEDSTKISCTIKLPGKKQKWDIAVTNPDNDEAVCKEVFETL